LVEQPFRKAGALLGTKPRFLTHARHGKTKRMEHHLGLLGRQRR
jgi:hypothetical protein